MVKQAKSVVSEEAKVAAAVVANEAAYTELMETFARAPKIEAAMEKAQEQRTGYYDSVVHAGSLCASREEWEATDALVQYNITHNIDGAAKRVKAEPRDEATKDGAKFKMPRSITNALSVVRFAWENAIPFNYKDKDGKDAVVSFSALRKARTQKLGADKEERAKHLTGVARLRHESQQMLANIAKRLGEDLSEATIAGLHKSLRTVVASLEAPAQAAKPSKARKDVAEDLSEAA